MIEQMVPVIRGQAYFASVWAKASADMPYCYVQTYLNGVGLSSMVLNLGVEYKQFQNLYPASFTKTLWDQATYSFQAAIRCSGATVGGSVWMDDISLTQIVQ